MQQTKKKQELVIKRMFDAPRDSVWKAWTDPEHVKKWWGPKNFTAPAIKIDLHVCGEYLYCMRSPEGKDFWSKGTFREIVPFERIVTTDSFADEKGNIVPATYYGISANFPLESLVTITFEEEKGGTIFTLKYRDVSSISEIDLVNMEQGWNESLAKLEGLLEKMKRSMAMLNFGSVMIGSSQPKTLADFYEKIIGKAADWSEGNWYGWQARNTLNIGEHSEVKGKAKEPQRIILNFEANDVKKEYERIKGLGAKVIKELYEMEGIWIATFADPDGNYFQVMSPWK